MKALVLSGGGSKGAYEAGVVKYLMDFEGRRYDLFAGVSVGALNAAFLAQYGDVSPLSVHSQQYAAEDLVNLWKSLDNSNVFKNWFPPYVSALWRPSVFDSSPLQKLVRSILKKPGPNKKLRVGATGLDTGTFRVFDETYPDVATAVLASSAFPGMLLPVEIEGQLYTDGGVCNNTPLRQAISAGATEIDVILCSPLDDPSTSFQAKTTAVNVGFRAISLLTDQVQRDSLVDCMVNRTDLKIRLIKPSAVLTSNPLDFSPSLIASMLKQGYADAEKGLSK
jgi:NTE family protein